MEFTTLFLIILIGVSLPALIVYVIELKPISALISLVVILASLSSIVSMETDIHSNYTPNSTLVNQNVVIDTNNFRIYKLNHTK